MELKFKKLSEDAVLPSYAKPGDAGLDLTAVSDGKMVNSEDANVWYYVRYRTGLAVEIPEGYVGLIYPRSSISKYALLLANAVAVIDSSYRGEIMLRFKVDAGVMSQAETVKGLPVFYKKGDKIGQLIVVPYPIMQPQFVETLSETERGSGGFGSTDVIKGLERSVTKEK